MDGTLDQSVALKAPKGLSEHFLRNPTDLALKRSVTHRAACENLNNERSPFVSNPVENKARGAAWIQHGGA